MVSISKVVEAVEMDKIKAGFNYCYKLTLNPHS